MRNRSLFLFIFSVILVAWVTTASLAQFDTDNDTLIITVDLPSQAGIELTVVLPEAWRMIDAPNLNDNAILLGRFELDSLGLEARTAVAAIALVEGGNALDVLDNPDLFPLPVTELLVEPTEITMDDRPVAVATFRLQNDLESTVWVIEVDPNLFALVQPFSDGVEPDVLAADANAILAGLMATLPAEATATQPPTLAPLPTATPRSCPYFARLEIRSVTAVNSEEGATGRDFERDGDQINLDYAMGPPLASGGVNSGTARQFEGRWSANMQGGTSATDIAEVSRHICDDDFGVTLELWEDDSTPFGEVKTVLGESIYIPLAVDGVDQDYPPEITYPLIGDTHDGNYEYQLVVSVQINEQNLVASDITPTVPPTATPRPTSTNTPTATMTPTATFTPTASDTPPPSDTPTATFTPTITPTASDTPTPPDTPTPSDTPTSSATPTASDTPTITPTASNTPTPTITFTPSPTFTPTGTPVPITCPGSLPSRLYPGLQGYLIPIGIENRVRSSPSTNGDRLGLIPLGGIFEVLDGPVCGDGFTWYEVDYNGLVGWTVEGGNGGYWLAEFVVRGKSPRVVCEAFTASSTNKRTGPGTDNDIAGQLVNGGLQILGQANGSDGFVWWLLADDTWVREDTVSERGTCNSIPQVNP